jgi:hypothetical protein
MNKHPASVAAAKPNVRVVISWKRVLEHTLSGGACAAVALAMASWLVGVDVNWNAVAAVSSAVAAIVAAAAVLLTLRAESGRVVAQETTWRRDYYSRLVTNPIMDSVESYREPIRQVLKQGAEKVGALCTANVQHGDVTKEVARIVASCDEHYYKLLHSVTVGTEAWGTDPLRTELRGAMESLQDELNLAVEAMLDGKTKPDFEEIVRTHIAGVLRIVMDHDPGIG